MSTSSVVSESPSSGKNSGSRIVPSRVDDPVEDADDEDDTEAYVRVADDDPVGVDRGLKASMPPNLTCRDCWLSDADVDWLSVGGGLYNWTPPNATR